MITFPHTKPQELSEYEIGILIDLLNRKIYRNEKYHFQNGNERAPFKKAWARLLQDGFMEVRGYYRVVSRKGCIAIMEATEEYYEVDEFISWASEVAKAQLYFDITYLNLKHYPLVTPEFQALKNIYDSTN